MRNKIDVYIKVIIRELRDTIPKMIGFFFVNKIEKEIEMVLVKELNNNFDILNNIKENPLIKTER
jgi:dynamin 1-like protein